MGKRSWKLFYARLRDLSLYLYRDAEVAAAATRAEEMALVYMKQVYRFQLHCHHLRFYYHHHEQQQQQLQRQQRQAENSPSEDGVYEFLFSNLTQTFLFVNWFALFCSAALVS